MSETWFDRLQAAVQADGRPLREISVAAKCGVNYLQQIFKDRKEPGVDRLISILNVLGTGSTLYVLTGRTFTREDEEFLSLVLGLDPSLREKALGFFHALQDREDS